jgi:GTP cyclohydrolase I
VWIADRGMASRENLTWLRDTGRHYIIGAPKSELKRFSGALATAAGWREVREGIEVKLINTLEAELQPHGVAAIVEGAHGCMTSRGVHQSQATMVTRRMLGLFRDQPQTRHEFLSAIGLARPSECGNFFP